MSIYTYTEWLYFHLRKLEPSPNSPAGVMIPDTVLFRWAQPFYWYFTSSDGRIRRKKKEKIDLKLLEEAFLAKRSRSGLVCSLLYYDRNSQAQRPVLLVEYLDQGQFGRPDSLS